MIPLNPISANRSAQPKTRRARAYQLFCALRQEPEPRALRGRAPAWVNARLERSLLRRLLPALEITPGQWEEFLAWKLPGREVVVRQVRVRLAPPKGTGDAGLPALDFSLSARGLKEFQALVTLEDASAVSWLLQRLLKREQDRFQARTEISRSTWKRFLEGSVYPTEDTARRIVLGLALNPEEEAAFRATLLHSTFVLSDPEPFRGWPDPPGRRKHPMKEDLRRRLAELPPGPDGKVPGTRQFLQERGITDRAWNPFRASTVNGITSQDTLLKLTLAFGMEREDAARFLALTGAVFAMSRDLAVLTCLLLSIRDIHEIRTTLDFLCPGTGKAFYPGLEAGIPS